MQPPPGDGQFPGKSGRTVAHGGTDEKTPIPPASDIARQWDAELRDWPPLEWPTEPVRAPAPTRRSVIEMRLLVVLGVAALVAFFIWLLEPDRRGDAWLFWPMVGVIAFRALWWLVEWGHYARPKFDCFQPVRREWKVDVLTTACPGEPRGMILRTLLAMRAIRYPHTDYLCDEGDYPVLREACWQHQ